MERSHEINVQQDVRNLIHPYTALEKIGGKGPLVIRHAGHPVAAAVALEALRIDEEIDIVGHVRKVAPHFQQRLHALASHPMVSQARGVGLLGALELVQDKVTRRPYEASTGVLARLGEEVLAQGLICRPLRDAIALSPPLIITEAQIDELFGKLERAMDATFAFARGLRLAA